MGRIRHASEIDQLSRLDGRERLLSDADLLEIRGDWGAGIAREVADDQLRRGARLSAHQRLRESIERGRG
jgi:hypothetical protein